MPIFPTAGKKLFIGGVLDAKSVDFVASDFTSQDFVEVKWLENLGSLGDESQDVSFNAIGEGRTQVMKGTRKAALMNVVCGADTTDEGQLAMIAAAATRSNYAFKVEFTDKPAAGASPKNSTRLFIGMVMNSPEEFGGANDVTKVNLAIQPNSNVVRVAAAAS